MSGLWNRRAAIGGVTALALQGGCAYRRTPVDVRTSHSVIARQLAPSGRLKTAINVGNVVLAQRGGPQGASGPSVDIANELGRRLGVPVELIIYESANFAVARLAEDRWDIGFMAVDPERATDIQFTTPYVFIDGTYMVPDDATFQSVTDLDRPGVRIAVGQGTAYDLFLSRTLKQATLIRSRTSLTAIEQYVREGHHAVGGVRQALVGAQRNMPGHRVLPDSFYRIEQAVAIPKPRPDGFAYVAALIETLKANGFVRASLDRAGQVEATVAPPAGER